MAKQKLFECLEHGTFEASNALDTKRNLAKCPQCEEVCTLAMIQAFDLEFTNRCHGRCTLMCPRAQPDFDREIGDMSDELLMRIVKEIKTWNKNRAKKDRLIKYVFAHLGGESLLHPKFVKYVNLLAEPEPGVFGPDIVVSTNAIPLNEGLAKAILGSRLHRLILSVDGVTAETYEKIRGMNFNTMQKNVDRLLEIAKERQEWGLKNPSIWIQILRLAENEDEWLPFVRKYSGNPRITSIRKRHPVEGLKGCEVFVKKVERFGGQMEIEHHPGWDGADNRRATCMKLWDRLSIFWNGDVGLCCYDINGKVIVGNLRRNAKGEANSIHGIWHGEPMRKIRKEMMLWQKSGGKEGSLSELCERC
jgi:uncharacterized Fe-S cluster-containing radical SAM superfamily protein